MRVIRIAMAAAAWFVVSSTASAQVILGNYPPTNDTNLTATVNNLRLKAMSFTMPAGPSIPLGDLRVRLGNYDSVADSPIFQIRDHTGSTTVPGTTVLFTWTTPAPGGAAIQDYLFTSDGSFSLVGGTSYWIVAVGVAGGTYDWRGSSPPITPTGIATYGGQSLFTTNGGTSWTTSTTINSFEMVVVPEPASLLLSGAGIGIAGVARCRRRR